MVGPLPFIKHGPAQGGFGVWGGEAVQAMHACVAQQPIRIFESCSCGTEPVADSGGIVASHGSANMARRTWLGELANRG
jgi:hypothetical protein